MGDSAKVAPNTLRLGRLRWLPPRPRRSSPQKTRELFRRDGFGQLWIEFAQARHDFLRKERDVRDRIFVIQKPALAEHQQVAEAADTVAQCLDLIVNIIRGAGKARTALDQLLDRR